MKHMMWHTPHIEVTSSSERWWERVLCGHGPEPVVREGRKKNDFKAVDTGNLKLFLAKKERRVVEQS